MIDYETIIVPVRCNCFTTKKNCIKKINQNIKFNPEIEYLKNLLLKNTNVKNIIIPILIIITTYLINIY